MYHEVSAVADRKEKVRHTNPSYVLSVSKFREQMRYLHENGYRTLSLPDLLDGTASKQDRALVITFDDGWLNVYTNAFPIMKDLGLTATVFVISGFVGQEAYMDWGQLREMNSEGFGIECHTATHRPLAELSESELKKELEDSKNSIEDALMAPVRFLSAPHGMVNRRILEMAAEAGYEGICTSEPAFRHVYGNPAIFKRVNIPDRCRMSDFRKIVQSEHMAILPTICSKKAKNLIKKFLGYHNNRRIYRFRYRIEE
jgi:peptidoglycan/xylan/chitin deacetylase (PgdA/CDA1 family)